MEYRIVQIPDGISQEQAEEVLDLFESGFHIYKEYVFTNHAFIIFTKPHEITEEQAKEIQESFEKRHTLK